ncbi:MAG: 2-keto-3-deoxy-D-arabino-heptulosonate-7-phosphate synthase I beta, partial [uncultured Thermoleophilia bacterium]
ALEILKAVGAEVDLPVATELMDARDLDAVYAHVDLIWIGARNMQNFNLLSELGKIDKPVMLKRGMSATVEELLMATEYVAKEGNERIILCERGIRTFERSTRFTLDIGAIPVLKAETHLPVVVDPSHAAGKRPLVAPLARAAVAAGADGLIVETHPNPEHALSDAAQQLPSGSFGSFVEDIERLLAVSGKTISR